MTSRTDQASASPGSLVVSLHDFHVVIERLPPAAERRLRYDLEGFYDFAATPPEDSRCIGRIEFSACPETYAEMERRCASLPRQLIVMHYPRDPEDIRFGCRGRLDGRDVVFRSTKRSIMVCDREAARIELFHDDEVAGAKDVRRVIRDQFFNPWLEQNGGLVVHSASMADGAGAGILAVGPAGSGKTSFFIAALEHRRRFTLLSADRTVLLPTDAGIALFASPEKINFFPGSLAAHPETRHLADSFPDAAHWNRDHKTAIHWRKVFDCFGARPAERPVILDRIVFPKYGAPACRRSLSADEFESRFLGEVHTGGQYALANPNWLGWYRPPARPDGACLEAVMRVRGERVVWRNRQEISAILDDGAAR